MLPQSVPILLYTEGLVITEVTSTVTGSCTSLSLPHALILAHMTMIINLCFYSVPLTYFIHNILAHAVLLISITA